MYHQRISARAICLIASLCVIAFTILATRPITPQGSHLILSDFLAYYGTATLLLHDQPVYDATGQTRVQTTIMTDYTGHPVPAAMLPYLYPPASLWLIAPLAVLPFHTAYHAWQVLCGLLFLACLLLLFRQGLGALSRPRLFGFILCTATLFFVGLKLGQPSALLLLFFLLVPVSGSASRSLWPVLALSLTVKPHLLLYVFLAKLGEKNIRQLAVMLGTACAVYGLSLLVQTAEHYAHYFSFLIDLVTTHHFSMKPERMLSLKGLLATILGPQHTALQGLTFGGYLAGGLAVFAAWHKVKKKRIAAEKAWALTLLASCFFSPWLHLHDGLLLIIPLLYVCRYCPNRYEPYLVTAMAGFSLIFAWPASPMLLKLLVYPALFLAIVKMAPPQKSYT